MTALVRRLGQVGRLLSMHGPSAAAAILVAEIFYKFHSFTLECLAFLATWFAIDLLIERPVAAIRGWTRARAGMI